MHLLPGIDAHPHAHAVLLPALGLEQTRAGAIARGGHAPARRGPSPSHAYLFHGPPGSGKRTVARAFVAALLAQGARTPDTVPGRVARGTHPDLAWIVPSGAGEMLVADIEDAVVAAAAQTPFESLCRVFVIEDAHTMNDQAANRLLKTLEEPPPFVHLILLAPSRREVLPTIASRCQHVRFDPLSSVRIEERLIAEAHGSEGGEAQGHGSRDLLGEPQDGARAHSSTEAETSSTEAETLTACARLALGDAGLAARLASAPGRALRARAQDFARGALHGDTARGADGHLDELLRCAREAGFASGEDHAARVAEQLELLPARERRRHEREAAEAQRRVERRARTRTLDLALRLVQLWLRDLWCVAEGAGELVYAVDRRSELEHDAAGRPSARLREGMELVQDTRLRLSLNLSEELALESLSYRLGALFARPV